MSGFVITILSVMGFLLYLSAGLAIGATLFRLRSSSWRSLGYNFVTTFVFGMPISLTIIYLLLWPIWISIELIARLIVRIKQGLVNNHRSKTLVVPPPLFMPDNDFSSAYPSSPKRPYKEMVMEKRKNDINNV